MTLLKIVVFFMVLVVAVVFFTLQRNGANLFEEPGLTKRLAVFFSINTAETADDSLFEELKTPVFNIDAEGLYKQVLSTGSQLGWGILANNSELLSANFVVRSPVFLFEDDVYVEIKVVSDTQSALYLRSSSRQGRADLAANSGHIQTMIERLHTSLNKSE